MIQPTGNKPEDHLALKGLFVLTQKPSPAANNALLVGCAQLDCSTRWLVN